MAINNGGGIRAETVVRLPDGSLTRKDSEEWFQDSCTDKHQNAHPQEEPEPSIAVAGNMKTRSRKQPEANDKELRKALKKDLSKRNIR